MNMNPMSMSPMNGMNPMNVNPMNAMNGRKVGSPILSSPLSSTSNRSNDQGKEGKGKVLERRRLTCFTAQLPFLKDFSQVMLHTRT